MTWRRYAIYYMPPADTAWAALCTDWLGWDARSGAVTRPTAIGPLPVPVEEITRRPRKYGLHATLRAPFCVRPGVDEAALIAVCSGLAQRHAPLTLPGLALTRLGRFLALCPNPGVAGLATLAAACVTGVDQLRAPPQPEELARRRAARLSAAQDAHLLRWGYPYVFDAFRFHITLSGPLRPDALHETHRALDAALTPLLPRPLQIDTLTLAAEAGDGRFYVLRDFALTGAPANPTDTDA